MSVPEPGTIQQQIDSGYRLFAFHERLNPQCTHSAQLDLVALRDELGGDFNLVRRRGEFIARLRCTACGERGRNMTIIYSPPRKG